MGKAALRLTVIVLLVLAVPVIGFTASAAVPYVSYNYDCNGSVTEFPDVYQPEQIISGEMLGIGGFISPTDFFNEGNMLYVLDTGNSRVVAVDTTALTATEIYVTDKDKKAELGKATGLYKDKESFYVADSGNLCIWCTDLDGNVTKKITKPDSEYFSDDIEFLPRKITGDSVGNLYAQCTGVFEGLVLFDKEFTFKGFFAGEKVQTTSQILQSYFWKQFMTSEQKEAMSNYVPSEIFSMDMSAQDFLYTITPGRIISGRSYKETVDSIRCLNPKGADILEPGMPQNVQTAFDNDCRYLNFVDIAYSDDGFINVLDNKQGKVYQLDENMRLVSAFAGLGGYNGTFAAPCAIEAIGDKIAVLDSQKGNITVFSLTATGGNIHKALMLYNGGDYTASLTPWKEVVGENPNFQLAYIGIGNALFNEGEYRQAMDYYELGKYTEGYGNAYREYRVSAMRSNYGWILLAAFMITAAGFIISRYRHRADAPAAKTVGEYGGARLMLYSVRHPFNGFDEMRVKKKYSYGMSAFIILLLVLLGVAEQQYFGKAFVMNREGTANILSVAAVRLGIVLLFVIANWAFSVLLEGKATLSQIWIFTGISLMPYIICGFLRVALSNFLASNENVFLSVIMAIGILWSFVILMSAFSVFHEYEIGKSLFIFLVTLIGMLLIVVLGFLIYNLMQNVADTLKTVFSEIMFRMNT